VSGGVLTRVEVRPRARYDDGDWYWQVPAVGQLQREGLDLAPVTVLVGENGSGKSTLVEAIAAAWKDGLTAQVHHWSPGPGPDDADLHRHLQLIGERPPPQGGCFLRAESMYGHFGGIDASENLLRSVGGRLNARSHGEGFLAFMDTRLTERGLWVLDEPESALSFRSCLRLLSLIVALRDGGSQVLLATHSPVLAAVPDAQILQLGGDGITACAWEDLELVQDWRDFLTAPQRWLRHLV